jgi:hypothetical protein
MTLLRDAPVAQRELEQKIACKSSDHRFFKGFISRDRMIEESVTVPRAEPTSIEDDRGSRTQPFQSDRKVIAGSDRDGYYCSDNN